MGYGESKNTVLAAKALLDKIVALADGAELEIPTPHPQQVQYALRAAFHAAEQHPKTFPDYCGLRAKYKISMRPTLVIVRPKLNMLVFGDPITKLAKSLESLTVTEAETFLQVVGAVIKHKAPLMQFPNAQLDDTAMARVLNWCQLNNYEVCGTNPLSLKKCQPSM